MNKATKIREKYTIKSYKGYYTYIYMQNSTSILFLYALIVISVLLATIIIQTVTDSHISAQQNNLNPSTTFTSYYSIPTAAAEEDDDDEDDIAEHNRNADKKHD